MKLIKTVDGYEIWLVENGSYCLVANQDCVADAKSKAIRKLLEYALAITNLVADDAANLELDPITASCLKTALEQQRTRK